MRFKIAFALGALATSSFAADAPKVDPPKTVTLTQDQLSRLIEAEASKAVANYVAQSQADKAKDVYQVIQGSFFPRPPVGMAEKPSPPSDSAKTPQGLAK